MKHVSLKNGFTLVELLISIGIFSVFIVIVSGVFGRFVEVQRHSIEQGVLILEVQSIVEAFIKEARTAYGSTYIVNNVTGNRIAFRNQTGACVGYKIGTVVANGISRKAFQRAEDTAGATVNCTVAALEGLEGVVFTPLSSNAIEITDIYFDTSISNASCPLGSTCPPDDKKLDNQGVITFVITAKSTKGNIPPLTVQNTVTSRQVKPYEE